MNRKTIKTAFINTLPILTGYVFLGFAFGLLMKTKGFPTWLPIVMSIVIYSGAMEFAAVPVLARTFDPVGSFILAVMLSARHLFYGLPMLKKYDDTGAVKPFLIFGLTDETFSLLSTTDVPEGLDVKPYYTAVTLLDYTYWCTGSLLGAVFGDIFSFNAEGLDFALTALFIVLFVEQLKDREGKISGISGFVLSAAALAVFGKGNMVIASMVLILAALLLMKKVIVRE